MDMDGHGCIDYSKMVLPEETSPIYRPKPEVKGRDGLENNRKQKRVSSLTTTLTKGEVQYLQQFIILGIPSYSDTKGIIRFIEFLTQALRNDAVDDIIAMIADISTRGRSINQDVLLVCLVKCYMHDKIVQQAVCDVILKLLRIPTHLFKYLMIMMIEETEKDSTESYYKALLKCLSPEEKKTRHSNGNNKQTGTTGNSHENATETMLETTKTNDNVGKTSTQQKGKHNARNRVLKRNKKLITKWYTDPNKSAEDLLLMLTKYPERYGWSHKILIRHMHLKFLDADAGTENREKEEKDIVIKYVLKGFDSKIEQDFRQFQNDLDDSSKFVRETSSRIFKYILLLEEVKRVRSDPKAVATIVRESRRHELGDDISFTLNVPATPSPGANKPLTFPCHYEIKAEKRSRFHLTIELLPSEMYKYELVWQELIKDLPMTALLRHLTHMSHLKLFDKEENVNYVKDVFMNENCLYPFIHPFQILKALMAYTAPQHCKKSKEWEIYPQICAILNDAFYLCLLRKEPCISFDKCTLCIDVGAPMLKAGFLGVNMFTAAQISLAIATAIERKGNNIRIYTCGSELKLLGDHPVGMEDTKILQQRIECINNYHDQEANLSLVINQACDAQVDVDTFIIFTKSIDSQYKTVKQAYTQYKEAMDRRNTKLVICTMEAVCIDGMDDNGVIFVCGGDADVLLEMYLAINPHFNASMESLNLDKKGK